MSSVSRYHFNLNLVLIFCVGHFYLTKLLLPTLIETAKLNPDGKARVISVSSGAHHVQKLNFDAFKDGPARRKMSPETLYGQSKFGVVVFAKELARRYADKGIVSISLNPGNLKTNLQREVVGFRRSMIVSDFSIHNLLSFTKRKLSELDVTSSCTQWYRDSLMGWYRPRNC